MSDSHPDLAQLPANTLRQVERLCARFEAAWKQGDRPRLEEFLAAAPAKARPVLLAELLPLDVEYRRRRGDRPCPADYAARFPEDERLVNACCADTTRITPSVAPPVGWPQDLPRVHGYEILGVLGGGGMGVVYQARQTGLNRVVALKMIHPGQHTDPERLARFRAEAEAVARLQHPHIVQIYEIGEWHPAPGAAACPFFSLEYVTGGSLAEHLKGHRLSPRSAAQLLHILAGAVHHAHKAGIVHRDLKPANVLLTFSRDPEGSASDALPSGSRLNELLPKVTDFGLAKRLEDSSGLTRTGEVMGTPSYMAPEQATGRPDDIGPATDVWALGAILYECLTGRLPFHGGNALETLEQVRSHNPVPPRRLVPSLARDLETICLQCLQKEPRKRYASAAALAEDLRCFLDGEPILARPVHVLERLGRWARRSPAVAALSLGLILVTVMGLALVLSQWRRAVASARDAETRAQAEKQARADEAAARRETERHLARLYLAQGLSLCDKGNVQAGLLEMVRSLELATALEDDALQHAIRTNLAGWRGRLVRRRAPLPDDDWIAAVAFSPDGKLAVTGNRDRTARLWDAATGRPVGQPLAHDFPVWAVAFSPDGETLLTGSGDDDPVYAADAGWVIALHAGGRTVGNGKGNDKPGRGEARLWDVRTGRLRGAPLAHPGAVVAAQFGPDGRTLLTVGAGKALLWKVTRRGPSAEPGNEPVPLPLPHPGAVLTATFDPGGETVVTGGLDGTARLWATAGGQPVGEPLTHPGPVTVTVVAPRRHALLTGALRLDPKGDKVLGGEARLWDISTRKPLGPALAQRGPLRGAAFSADGQVLVTGGFAITAERPEEWRGAARVWDAVTGQPAGPGLDHPEVVTSVAVSPNGRLAVTGCRDGHVRLWHVGTGQLLTQAEQEHGFNHGTVSSLSFSRDGRLLLAGNLNDRAAAELFEVPAGQAIPPLFAGVGGIYGADFSPDGATLLTGCNDATARLWDMATGRPRGPPLRHPGRVATVAFGPDGETFVTASSDGTVQLWGTVAGRLQARLLPEGGHLIQAAFSRDGRNLLTSDWANRVQLWETATGRLVRTWKRPEGVRGVAFSPDGSRVLTGCWDGIARLWEIDTGSLVREWKAHPHIGAVAFHPAGRLCATTGAQAGVAQVWDVETAKPSGPPLVHAGVVEWVAFSPDGRTVATASEDKARLWDVATGTPLGPPLAHEQLVVAALFSPDARQVLTTRLDGTAQRWEVPRPVGGDVERVRLWIEVLTGMYVDDNGVARELEVAAWQEHSQRLERLGGPPMP